MRSLLAALVVGLLVSLVVVFAVQWSAVRAALDKGMRDFVVDELVQDSDEIFGALVPMPGGETTLSLQHFDPAFLKPTGGRYYQVMVERTVALRSPSLVYESFPMSPLAPGQQSIADVSGSNQHRLLASTRGYDLRGRPVTIAVAAELAPIEAEVGKLLERYTHLSLAMFALLVLLQAVIVRLALAPLARVKDDVGRLERGETAQLRESVPSEVLPLVREVNRLLALLAQRLQRSREALGNLAHALKAPLTALTHMAEDDELRERHPALAGEFAQQLEILRGRVDSELRRARVAGGRVSGSVLGVKTEIEALAATLAKIHREKNPDIACRIDPALRFHGDREDLLELCGNLLDNACKWSRSRVVISAQAEQGMVLSVEDDGPGCSAADLDKLAQRGVRLDEATEGHGLGLAIARSIAASYGATLHFSRSQELGGFKVSVAFPAA